MPQQDTLARHYLLRAVILFALAAYIGLLNRNNTLAYYVTPQQAVWVRLCPIPLAVLGLNLLAQALPGRSRVWCGCGHLLPATRLSGAVMYGLFLFPLLLGFLLPDRPLGSTAAVSKGLSLHYGTAQLGETERFRTDDPFAAELASLAGKLYAEPVIPVYPQIFSETLGSLDLYKHDFAGREVAVSGFVYAGDSRLTEGVFAVGRFLVQCCTADATPLGILVDPGTQNSFPADTWIRVRGKLQIVSFQGKETLLIKAESVTAAARPGTPYVYTSPDAVQEWERLRPLSR